MSVSSASSPRPAILMRRLEAGASLSALEAAPARGEEVAVDVVPSSPRRQPVGVVAQGTVTEPPAPPRDFLTENAHFARDFGMVCWRRNLQLIFKIMWPISFASGTGSLATAITISELGIKNLQPVALYCAFPIFILSVVCFVLSSSMPQMIGKGHVYVRAVNKVWKGLQLHAPHVANSAVGGEALLAVYLFVVRHRRKESLITDVVVGVLCQRPERAAEIMDAIVAATATAETCNERVSSITALGFLGLAVVELAEA